MEGTLVSGVIATLVSSINLFEFFTVPIFSSALGSCLLGPSLKLSLSGEIYLLLGALLFPSHTCV